MPAPYRYTGQVLCKLITIHHSGTLTGNRISRRSARTCMSIILGSVYVYSSRVEAERKGRQLSWGAQPWMSYALHILPQLFKSGNHGTMRALKLYLSYPPGSQNAYKGNKEATDPTSMALCSLSDALDCRLYSYIQNQQLRTVYQTFNLPSTRHTSRKCQW